MLKRQIENWLINISEREFDIPFRLLLEAEGHVSIGHSTIHGPMELGKDIVSYHEKEEIFYFFQLKAGDADLNDWNDMERQIRQMVEVPYTHPNYTVGEPYRPIWVCTGQLSETVRFSLGRKNDEYKNLNKPHIEVLDRNILIDKYANAFFALVYISDTFLIDYLRVWSHTSDYLTDEANLKVFYHNYLSNCPLKSEVKTKRYLSTYSLIMSQLSHRYLQNLDKISAIDCLILALTQFYYFIFKHHININIYKSCYSVMLEILYFHFDLFLEEFKNYPELAEDLLANQGSLSEIFELPLRTHSLGSKIALLSILKSLQGKDNSEENNVLTSLIKNNSAPYCNILSERQMGTYWISTIGLLQSEDEDVVKQYLTTTFEWILSFHGKGGLQGLPDPYQDYEIIPFHHLWIDPENDRLIDMNGQSYFLATLLKLLIILNCKDVIAQHWQLLSQLLIREVRISNPAELFSYRTEDAHTITYTFPIMGSWANIREHFSQRLSDKFDTILKRHPESLLFLTLAYPWRAQWRETDRYIHLDKGS